MFSLFSVLIFQNDVFAQTPQSFPYQAVARNASGNLLANQLISVRFSILDGSVSGATVYQESQSITTNTLGLFNVNIGQGTALIGTFSGINWGTGSKYLKVELDPTGGAVYTVMGTSQLLSVPYAIYAGATSNAAAGNGLVKNGDSIKLGGHLTKNTTINQDGNSLNIVDLNGSTATLLSQSTVASIQALSTTPVTQTFISTADQKLFSVELRVSASAGASINLEIKNSSGIVIGSKTISFVALFDGWQQFNIAAQPVLQVGSVFTLSVSGQAGTNWYYSNTNPYLSGAASIGATNDFGFIITSLSEAPVMTINNQNIGIGTITPATKLDVNGQIRIQGGSPGSGKILTSDANGLGSWQSPAPSLWTASGTHIFNSNTGNVGIGTPFPGARLHVNGGDLFVESSSGLIRFGYSGGNQWEWASTGAGADLRWYTTTDGGTTITPRHYFSQNGNIGIGGFSGATPPWARLHVIGSGSNSSTNNFVLQNSLFDTLMRVRDDGRMGIGFNGTFGRTINLGGTGINFYTTDGVAFGGAIFPTDTSLVLWSNSNANNYLILQPSWGRTGIGTYFPQAKLDVNGTAVIGASGSVLNEIIKVTVAKNLASIPAGSSTVETFSVTNAAITSSVMISPTNSLPNGLLIAYARVSSAGVVEVKFTNVSSATIDPAAMDFYITVVR